MFEAVSHCQLFIQVIEFYQPSSLIASPYQQMLSIIIIFFLCRFLIQVFYMSLEAFIHVFIVTILRLQQANIRH